MIVALWPATVTKPVRATPLLAATVTVTARAPLPSVGEVVIQGAPLTTVHVHAGAVDTVSVALDPTEPTASVLGAREYEQLVTPAPPPVAPPPPVPPPLSGGATCVNETLWPATTIVVLLDSFSIASTRTLTLPLPVPLTVEIATQPTVARASQRQPASVVTAMVTLPPDASTDGASGETWNRQTAACC